MSFVPPFLLRPSQGLLGTGEKRHYFHGNRGTIKSKLLSGTGEQCNILGNRECDKKEQVFDFKETAREQANVFQGKGICVTPKLWT